MKKIIITAVALAFFTAGFAQESGKVVKADEKYTGLAFNEALELYTSAYDSKQGNLDYIASKIANCYRLLGKPSESLKWFSKVSNGNSMEPINYLYYAQALASSEKYEAAIDNYKKFLENYPNDARGTLGIEACERARDMAKRPQVVKINKTNVNTEFSDFGPSASPEGLVFASNRRNDITFDYTDKWTGANYLDLYVAKNDGQGGFSSPVLMDGEANTVYHESNAAYAPNGKMMVFTRSQFNTGAFGGHIVKSAIDNVVKLKLVVFVKNDQGKWVEGPEFPYNDPTVSYAHPTFSNDSHILYFCSDRSGGFGGTDIWRCHLDSAGNFEAPENLGENVNTAGQEMFPFVDKHNTLYFSSNGHAGFGGLDIFRTPIDHDTHWYKGVTNIGMPLNGPADDFAVTFDTSSNRGFFSSNREGGMGSDDIYGFIVNGGFLELEILDEATHRPIAKANVIYNKDVYAVSDIHGLANGPVELDKIYDMYVEANGYQKEDIRVSTMGLRPDGFIHQVVYLRCAKGSILKGVVSEERSGLPIDHATVTLFNKVTHKEEYAITDKTGAYSFDICRDIEYMVHAEKKNYVGDSADFDTKDMILGTVKVENLALKGDMPDLVFYDIYFDFDMWFLRKNSSTDLEKMYSILSNNKSLRVQVGAHTDSRGTDEYNQRLSQRRAESVVKYLVKRGISASRIIPHGYGEKQLTNICADGVECTDEQHQANRRVEFKLIDKDNNVVGVSLEKQP